MLELVGPARVVEQVLGDERDVVVAGLADRLAVVDGLEHGELAGPVLHEPREPEQVLGAFRRSHGGPDLLRFPRSP